MSALRVAFAGTPEFALPALHALLASPHQLVGVLTQPDRPSGRGRHVLPSPVKLVAESHQVPLAQPARLASDAELTALEAWRPDALVVVAYGLVLPPAVLKLPRLGCINIHASLLPRWRGAAPIARAILAGDAHTGVTIMSMDTGLDTGPILLERSLPIDRADTTGSLQGVLATLGAALLLEALEDIAAGRAHPRPQPAAGATYAPKVQKAEALIDWRAAAIAIERQVRAFNPWPIAETRWGGEPLRIHAARAAAGRQGTVACEAGTVIAVEREAIWVACGEGSLAITELQRPGRKRLGAAEFSRAGQLAVGQRLG